MEINGLPLHPLVVHAAVVFLPLAALLSLVYAAMPRWRWATRWPLVGLTAVALGSIMTAYFSGRDFLDLRYPHLAVRLTSHDVDAVTERDVELARRISAAAADLGVAAEPARVSVWELALDAADHDAIKPFWKAVLGYDPHPSDDNELDDPAGAAPTLWFQGTERHDEPRQRFHVDVWVPHDVAERRLADALDAGGTLVSDAEAPSFWVLADADGNKACICTWQDRG